MIMPPRLRKFMLAMHITLSVGWVGAAVAYIAVDVTAASSQDAATLRSAYLAMGLIAGSVIVPLAIGTFVSGLVVSLGTRWGLFRHWWVLVSFVLTTLATVVLLVEMQTIGHLAAVAADPKTSADDLRSLGGTLLHSVGGTAVLLIVLVLNVYKPPGLTAYGWRRQQEERARLVQRAATPHGASAKVRA
jgi:hypothetical protein